MQLRAGYGFYGSPFTSDVNDGKRQTFSGGFGFRGKSVYTDLAYSYMLSNVDYYLYGTENISVNPVDIRFGNSLLMLTVGYRFE
jgi:hypothetical protein